jgi:hypothetical protein
MAKVKLKTKIKTAVKKAGSQVKTAVKKVEESVKEAGHFVVLLPFRIPMIALLKARGVDVPLTIKTNKLVTTFNDVVIHSKSHYDYLDDNYNEENFGEEIAIDAAKTIIGSVLEFFKKLKDKKANGEKLTAEEERFLYQGDKLTEVAKNSAIDVAKEQGTAYATDLFKKYWWVLPAIIALYFVGKKIMK